MFALTIPLLGFGALLLIAVVRCRGNLFHPSAVLCAAYAVMSASSVVYGVIKETWLSFPDDAANSSTLLLLLLSASLAPSFIIKRPDLSMDSMKRCFGGMIFGLAAIVGIVGFVCLLPTFLITTSLDAYAVKQLGQGALAEAGSYLTVGVVVSALSGVFGLLVFCDTTFELNWIVRIGLLLGLMNYALIMECNKSRDWPVYYLFYFLLYFWLFRDKWRRTMRKFYFTFILCILGSGVVMFTHKTIQRFGSGDTSSISALDGTLGYLGQQVTQFIAVAEEDEVLVNHAEMAFPVYFYFVNGEWVDVGKLLGQRTKEIEWTFSTFVGTLFLAIGWRWSVITILVLAAIAAALFSRQVERAPGTYVVAIMLYGQCMFQGVFYFMQYNRFGNGTVIIFVCMGIIVYFRERFGTGINEMRRRVAKLDPAS